MRLFTSLFLLLAALSLIGQSKLNNTKVFFKDLIIEEVQGTQETSGYWQSVIVKDDFGIVLVKKWMDSQSDTIAIPFCRITGITENWDKNELSIHLITGGVVDFSMILGTVRNVSGRMILEIRKVVNDTSNFCQSERLVNPIPKSFVYAAVFEELIRMNISSELADKVSNDNMLYVKKCNICMGSELAFRNYVKFYEVNSEERQELPILQSGDLSDRLSALEKLVTRSVDSYLSRHAYTDQEIKIIREMLEKERQNSMNMTNGKACASCDGACKLPGTN